MFIGISGIIGVGKSTLTEILSREMSFTPIYEPVEDNNYLQDFYVDIEKGNKESKIPILMQLELLGKRYLLHQKCLAINSVADRTIYEDTIFAKKLRDSDFIDVRDFSMYMTLYRAMKRTLMYPDVVVYLRTHPEVAYERIQNRSRDCESKITIEYLRSLSSYYEEFICNIGKYCPVIEVDWNRSHIPNSKEYLEDVCRLKSDILRETEKPCPFFRAIGRI